jgi:hypothetical protein
LVVREAESVLNGTTDLLDASRRLLDYLLALGLSWDDPDYRVIGLIESETEDLPVGKERDNWAPEALARKESLVEHALSWAESIGGLDACRRLVNRFSSAACLPVEEDPIDPKRHDA